jgi:hypothetical protein
MGYLPFVFMECSNLPPGDLIPQARRFAADVAIS